MGRKKVKQSEVKESLPTQDTERNLTDVLVYWKINL